MSAMSDVPILGNPNPESYEVPTKYQGWTDEEGNLLAGKRIDPKSALGKELALLRMSWKAKFHLGMKEHEDVARRLVDVSSNVPIDLNQMAEDKWRTQRDSLIRKRVNDYLEQAFAKHGRYPTSMGIPADALEEVREACWDYDVDFVLSTA